VADEFVPDTEEVLPPIGTDEDWPEVCTCATGTRDGVLVDWVRGIVTHPYTDCPRRQYTDRLKTRG
jgi:hypothetical protein